VKIHLPVFADAFETGEKNDKPMIAERKQILRFLIIDDEHPIRDFLEELLKSQGHTVFTAATGKDGLEIFTRENPDLVITDLGMPGMSGWEVASTVKSLSPATRVLLMTGWGISLEAEKARQRGVDLILSKPFQIAEIQTALDTLMEMPNLTGSGHPS
jgi:CheY-like chemotaxis protein